MFMWQVKNTVTRLNALLSRVCGFLWYPRCWFACAVRLFQPENTYVTCDFTWRGKFIYDRPWVTFFLLDTKTKFHIGGTGCSYPYDITNIYSQEIQGIYPAPPESGLPKETGVASYLWIISADIFSFQECWPALFQCVNQENCYSIRKRNHIRTYVKYAF